MSTPTLWTDTGVGFFSGVQYISVEESEGIMLGSAHASTIVECEE